MKNQCWGGAIAPDRQRGGTMGRERFGQPTGSAVHRSYV